MKTLVFFTSFYPYGIGEAFIESEYPFLSERFERIIIVTNDLKTKEFRKLPPKTGIIRFPYSSSLLYKIRAVFSVTSKIFKDEAIFIRKNLRLSLSGNVLSTLLGSIAKGYETRDFVLNKIVKQYSLNFSETLFYAYWMNDIAIGLAMLKEKLPEAQVICRAHRGDLYFYTTPNNYLPLRTYLLNNVNRCYVISENGREHLAEILGKEKVSNVVVSRLGTFNKTKSVNQKKSTVPVLVSCSSYTVPKRVPLTAEALSRIKGIKLKWLHFGWGPLKEKMEYDSERSLSGNQEIEFSFMGAVPNSELLHFYSENKIDLFINVSSSEGIPVSIMEAMSFGIPVIATAAGGTKEIVKDGFNGYLLNVISSPKEIANTITKYFSLSNLQKAEMGINAFKMWDENFNAEKNFRSFIKSLDSL